MSENEKQKQPDQNTVDHLAARNSPQPTRRRLLKSTVAIPVIMTLHSGAALAARTSNLAGPELGLANAAGDDKDVFCALPKGQIEGGAYDMGDNPEYKRIPKQTEDGIDRGQDDIISECEGQAGGGILISSTAFNSIAGRAPWTDITGI